MSVVFDVEGIVIGDRAKLEQIAERYLNDQEAKEMNYYLEAKINEDGNLEFTAQGVGRQFQTPDVENVIERYLDNEVECYKLWGCTDGCWDQYTNDTEGRFYKQWYVEDYANKAKKVFFDNYEDAKSYAMNIIKNDPEYVANLEESGMDEEEFFDENCLNYLDLNQEPIKIVNITRVNYEDVVNTDIYNEDIPTTEKGNYIGKYQNLVIPIDFHDKIVDVEYFYPDNLSLLDDNSSFCCVEDSMSIMDWYPEITGYLVRFVSEQNFKIEKGKSIGMIFENFEDAQTKLASMENNDSSSSDFQQNEDDLESPFVMDHQDLESPFVMDHQDLDSPFVMDHQEDNSSEDEHPKSDEEKEEEERYERADWAFTIACGTFNEGNPERESDFKEAFDLFSEAADLGYAEAMAYMGVMYRNGFVVEKDDAKAAEWYQKAIDTGGRTLLTSLAYNNLGILYQRGEGVKKDLEKARDLFQMAVDKDHNERAKQHLDETIKELTKRNNEVLWDIRIGGSEEFHKTDD